MLNLPSFGIGFVVGFGTGFVSREIAGAAKRGLKPVAKEMVRSGIQVVDKSREAFAHVGEAFEDLVAEIRSEGKSTATETKPAKTTKKKPAPAKA